MPPGLKQELGLGDPRKPGSAKQANDFRAAYQAAASVINECLRYTAAHAELAKHGPHAGKRDTCCQAYQAALSRIDATNPAAAQGAIDQVLAAVQSLKSNVEALKTAAEKAFNEWTGRREELASVTDNIREMVDWGHEKANALQAAIEGITGKANSRAYDEALKFLEQLLPKARPLYEEYLKQKQAQTEYEAALGGLQTRLDPVRACKFKSLEAKQKELTTSEDQMKEAASKKDFLAAMTLLRTLEGKLGTFETELKAVEEKKKKFESVRGDVDKKVADVSKEKFDELAALDQEIADLTKQMDEAVANDDYDKASKLLSQVSAKAAEKAKQVEELKPKKEYETAYKKVEAEITQADGTDPDGHFELKNSQASYQTAKKELDGLVASKDYKGAQGKLAGVSAAAKGYADKRKAYDDYKSELSKVKADIDYVEELRDNSPPNGAYNAETTLYGEMINNFHQGNFEQALKCMKTLQGKVADLKKRVDENDKKAKPTAEAAEKEVQKLAGGKKVSELSNSEKANLVKKLKKLSPEKQRQILEDMHGPSTKLTDEQRQIQIALYNSMDLDKQFKKADEKVRKQYQSELQKDTELHNAVRSWNAVKDGKPVVDLATKQKMMEKILASQSKAYGIPVPKIEWFTDTPTKFGSFSADTTRIKLNTANLNNAKEMIDTIIHENTHNFQDSLVKRYVAGKIPKTDPMYEQAKTFAATHHWNAYVRSSENGPAYKNQPEEMQAWEAGGTESKKLMSAFKKKPKKRK